MDPISKLLTTKKFYTMINKIEINKYIDGESKHIANISASWE